MHGDESTFVEVDAEPRGRGEAVEYSRIDVLRAGDLETIGTEDD